MFKKLSSSEHKPLLICNPTIWALTGLQLINIYCLFMLIKHTFH